MSSTISVSKQEYDDLVRKASLFEQYIENEELSEEELTQIHKALKGPFLSKTEFLKRHSDLR